MQRLIRSLMFILMVCAPVIAAANPASQHFTPVETIGHGRMSVLLWDAYDATLYAPSKPFDATKPYALTLTYLMDFDGADIAERSVEEMRKQGFSDSATLERWGKQMAAIFPNVKEGDSITGVRDASGNTAFYHNDTAIGTITDAAFTQHFFNIWLSEKTSEPKLRKKLLGM